MQVPSPIVQWLRRVEGNPMAGDFERKGNKSVSVHTEEIVRDWHNEDNAMAFQEMHQ